MFELGYLTLGTSSIYLTAILTGSLGFGSLLIYFVIFGDISISLAQQTFAKGQEDSIFLTRWFYVVLLGALLVPVCFKRKLAEMKWVSMLLFAGIGAFVLLFAIQLVTLGTIKNHD